MASETTPQRILRIDASARFDGSASRALVDALIETIGAEATVTRRDLAADTIPQVSSDWVAANFTDPAERTEAQKATLAASDALVDELKAVDTIVIGAPIYNFGMPAALKAWIDQICRARETFRYTENGPVGLLTGKKAYIVVASGGVKVDSPADFMTPHLKFVLGFVGIDDVTVIAADGLMSAPDKESEAKAQIAALAS